MAQQKSILILLAALIAGLGMWACQRVDRDVEAAGEGAMELSPAEKEFLTKVLQSNRAELEIVEIANKRSMNPEVKGFAEMLKADHEKALDGVSGIMKKYGMRGPGTLSPEAMLQVNNLSKLSGTAFDKEFARVMVENHQKSVKLFEQESKVARNPDIKDYVDTLIPTLKQHLAMAENLLFALSSTKYPS
jgi:putative membrane protein